MEFPDVMVDIETGGLSPDHSPIIQIAAVRFNLAARTVDSSSMFDRCLALPPNRFWDESTREFWGRQKRSVLAGIQSRAESPEGVMDAFAEWAGYQHPEPLRFWGKPTHFDFSFLSSYFREFDIPNPFHFRYARDMNSFICGLAGTSELQKVEVEFEGDVHNALFDVLNQISVLFKAMDLYAPAHPPTLH